MTKRKSAVKAHSTHRKTAPKVATKKARVAYLKAAAPFEDLTRDAQMSEPLRTFAEKGVVHTRELCERPLEAVLESWERFVDAGQGAVALNRKAIEIARRNINTGFGLAMSLARAKNVSEIMELQAAYWRKQLSELAAQAGDMRSLSTKVAADVAAPLRTHALY
jgi:hypothetical protein